MADEYIRKQDVSDWLKQYGQDVLHGKYKFSLMYIWKNIMDLPSADVVPICQTGCKGCKRENNLVIGSCRLCARFYEDMYEGIE